MKGFHVLVAVMVLGCQTVDPNSPEGAFKKIALCIDKVDARCLYNRLDRDSRWSIQTIHKSLVEIRGMVEKYYPDDAKVEAYGTWKDEAFAKDYADLFAVYCTKRRCLERVAKNFGAVSNLKEKEDNLVVLETTRGGEFEMFFAEDRWGITTFQNELQKIKLRILDRASQEKKNAAEFEEQRSAGTIGDGPSEGQGE